MQGEQVVEFSGGVPAPRHRTELFANKSLWLRLRA